jgi:hypothetical protein
MSWFKRSRCSAIATRTTSLVHEPKQSVRPLSCPGCRPPAIFMAMAFHDAALCPRVFRPAIVPRPGGSRRWCSPAGESHPTPPLAQDVPFSLLGPPQPPQAMMLTCWLAFAQVGQGDPADHRRPLPHNPAVSVVMAAPSAPLAQDVPVGLLAHSGRRRATVLTCGRNRPTPESAGTIWSASWPRHGRRRRED